jgi:hypothetical protein
VGLSRAAAAIQDLVITVFELRKNADIHESIDEFPDLFLAF